jgi:transposase
MDTSDGELHQQDLHHQKDDIRAFYSQFSGEVIVGLEASGYSRWFEQLLDGLSHQVLIGDATEIRRLARRRRKNDHRDADHILEVPEFLIGRPASLSRGSAKQASWAPMLE